VVFIITGTPESDRNTVSRLFAEALGWEFVDAENLRMQGNVNAARGSPSRACPDRPSCTEALSAAINRWIYEWRDVVVSCPALTVGERRKLSTISSLVKVVCVEEFHATDHARVSDQSVGIAISPSPAGSYASRNPEKDMSILDLSRPVEEIIAELTSVLTT
jgi:gluconate kinase